MPGIRSWMQVCGAAVVSVALAGAAASIGQSQAQAKTFVVSMQIAGFEPATLTVKPGDRIRWVNKDLFPHTATADDKTFDSHSVSPARTWTFVAGKAGTYTYACTFHPTMKGTIKVQ
jgi:plastocyanin